MKSGQGSLLAFGFAEGLGVPKLIGGSVEYRHRVSDVVALFGAARASVAPLNDWKPDFGVGAGVRIDW